MLSSLRHPSPRRTARRRVALLSGLGLVLMVPMTVAAVIYIINAFADISGNSFASYINSLAGAGITTGCGGGAYPNGNFCPDDSITRGQEAAFVNRGMPRVAMSTTAQSTAINSSVWWPIAQVTIRVGGVSGYESGAHQYVEVHGHFNFWDDFASKGCPCQVDAYISDGPTRGQMTTGYIPAVSGDVGSGDVSGVFAEGPGAHTFTMWAIATGSSSINIDTTDLWKPTLIATTTPFGDTGGNVLSSPVSVKTTPSKSLPSH